MEELHVCEDTSIKPMIRWIWARCEDAAVIATQETGVMATPTGPFKHTIKRVSPIFIFPLIKNAAGTVRSFPPTLVAHADFIYPPTDIQLAIMNQYTACLIFTVFTVECYYFLWKYWLLIRSKMARRSRSILITLFVRSNQGFSWRTTAVLAYPAERRVFSAHIFDGCVKFNSWALQGKLSKTVCF